MPIPKDILAVPRPKNSVVICYGKNKDLFAVRERIGCKRRNGRNVPVNGKTIGHIVDGKYIAMDDKTDVSATGSVDIKGWADVTMCDVLFSCVLDELRKVYSNNDALKIYCIAILRVCNPGIKNGELKSAYEESFLSEKYPGVALSANTVCTFLNNLGKNFSRIVSFMRSRAEAVKIDHHLIVDGTLKTDNSTVDTMSGFSHKSRVKGSKEISVIYAFNLDTMEPVCSKCYPGNMLDITAFDDFLSENHITKGLIVSDKGIPATAAEERFAANKDMHYLYPLKRSSKLIETHDMLTFDTILSSDSNITCRKAKVSGKKKFLYSFRDAQQAAKEEQDWLRRAKKDGTYSPEELARRQKTFGTIVFECDLDLPLEIVYKAYSMRWEIEIVMRYYKCACEFDDTRVHDDYSVIASEFCDFLSSLLTCKLLNRFDKDRLLDKRTYKDIMNVLRHAKKVKVDEKGWQMVKCGPAHVEIMQTLGLLPKPDQPEKRRPGRPKKNQI